MIPDLINLSEDFKRRIANHKRANSYEDRLKAEALQEFVNDFDWLIEDFRTTLKEKISKCEVEEGITTNPIWLAEVKGEKEVLRKILNNVL